jgi:membrane-associated phospholipid phosphatase
MGGVGHTDNSPASAFLNGYAAVPSIHVCFALMVGFPMASLVRRRAARIAWRTYPLLIVFVVVATGNHYLTDVVLGGLTAAASWVLAERLFARARPERWAFGQAPA